MSVKVPPLMFGEETSSTPPSQHPSASASVLKLLRKVTVAPVPTTMLREIRYLSLTPFWSSTNASLGAVSGDTVAVKNVIPLSGGWPAVPLTAVHPAGMAGAVTPSKFSVHGGAGVGVAAGVGVGAGVAGVAVPPGVGVGAGVAVPPGVAVGPGVDVGPGVAV